MSIDNERALIGAALLVGDKLPPGAEHVSPDDFENVKHRRYWLAITDLLEARSPVDAVSVAGARPEFGTDDRAYLLELTDTTPTAANAGHYATLVKRSSRWRQYQRLMRDAVEDLGAPIGADDAAVRLATRLREISESGIDSRPERIGELVKRELTDMDRRRQEGGTLGWPLGFGSLDEILGGIRPGNVTVIAGSTGDGKTSMALNAMTALGTAGRRCLVFSLEMLEEEMTRRTMASESGVDVQGIETGKLGQSSYARLAAACGRLNDLPVWLYSKARTVRDIQAVARQHHAREGLEVLCVDYLQLVSATVGRGKNREQEVAEVSRGLKELSIELKIAVIALSQFNRAVGDSAPKLSNLRESGSIEQDASQVIAIWKGDGLPEDERQVEVLKNRNGPAGKHVVLRWIDKCTRFEDKKGGGFQP